MADVPSSGCLCASFARLADVLLAVRGVDATAARVVARWAPIETETDAEGMELVAAKVENGVPLRVALLEAGYTAEQVDAWAPDGAATLSPKAAALLATALRDFAQAETLGVVTSAELAEATDRMPAAVAAVPRPAITPHHQQVYDLFDAGRSPIRIAEELHVSLGEVELILNLRNFG